MHHADQFPAEKRERYCKKAQKLVGATLAATKFAGCPVVPVAARPGSSACSSAGEGSEGGEGGADSSNGSGGSPVGMQQLVDALLGRVRLRAGAEQAAVSSSSGGGSCGGGGQVTAAGRPSQGPFLFYIDHCFAIKGQGTVLTGGQCA